VGRKAALLDQIKVDKSELMSNHKFAKLLEALYVEVPTKLSPTTGKETYAFAKSDKEFTALLEHENPEVQALVAARLGVKSTIAETRALKLTNTAQRGDGKFPVMLHYWGAKTTGRHSGGNKINPQNIPARGPGSELRKAMIAPPGHLIVVGDSANIELRVVMACAGQTDALEKLKANVDLYCDFASQIYGYEVTKENKAERFLGKVAMLSLQYGAGYQKFKEIVRLLAKQTISDYEAERVVNFYRNMYSSVSSLWRHCNYVVLPAIYNNELFIDVDVNGWFVTMPKGFRHPGLPGVMYDGLTKDSNNWVYGDNNKLYGGKVVENLCQHMARHVVMWQTAAINTEYPVALSVHDEVVCVVKKNEAEKCAEFMTSVLNTAPAWCRDKLPVACEVHIGNSYGEAKG
jgi:DNA polymerase